MSILPPIPSGTDPYLIVEVVSGQIIARQPKTAEAFCLAQQLSVTYRLLRVYEVHVLAGGTVHAPLITFRDGAAVGEKEYLLPKSLPFIV